MSVFAPVNNPGDTSTQKLKNITFFREITVKQFRDATRVQGTITDGRIIENLRSAIITVNDQLSEWKTAKVIEGYATLDDVPSDDYGVDGATASYSELTHHYLTAVYSITKALLIEKYRDVGTSVDGHQRADDIEQTENDYRREAAKSIRKILGKSFVSVELI